MVHSAKQPLVFSVVTSIKRHSQYLLYDSGPGGDILVQVWNIAQDV